MRVMVLVKESPEHEAGGTPDERLVLAMGKYNNELVRAGVMLTADGLQPSSKGKRVRFDGEVRTVIDGPFAESRELIAGFWIWQVSSMEEALEWIKRAPFGGGMEIELRPVHDMDDFIKDMGPEVHEQRTALLEQLAGS